MNPRLIAEHFADIIESALRSGEHKHITLMFNDEPVVEVKVLPIMEYSEKERELLR